MITKSMSDAEPADEADIWIVLRRSVAANPPAPTAVAPARSTTSSKPPPSRRTRFTRWATFRLLDSLGLVLWLYIVLKLFVFDVDRSLVAAFPALQPVLEYRALFVLLVFAAVGVFFWRFKALLAIAYVAVFPLVVVFWKLPNLVYRLRLYRSWIFWMLLFQGLIAGFRNIRYAMISMSLGLASVVVILVFSDRFLLFPAALLLLGLLFWAAFRVVRASVQASWFIKSQRKALDFLASAGTDSVVRWKHDFPAEGPSGVLNKTQIQQLTSSINTGVMINRLLYLWAYKLQQYHESSLVLLMNLAAYFLLYIGSVFTFGFVNLALLKADPSQFSFSSYPSVLAIMLYGLSTLFLNDGGGVTANGDLAYALRIVAGTYGPLFLGVFLVSTALTFRGAREDRELKETVAQLRARARSQESQLTGALRVSVDEALERLRQLGFGGVEIIYEYFRRTIPPDFMDEDTT
jgi:hypothetical protein